MELDFLWSTFVLAFWRYSIARSCETFRTNKKKCLQELVIVPLRSFSITFKLTFTHSGLTA